MPFLGLCLGMQLSVLLEFARNVAGYADAHSDGAESRHHPSRHPSDAGNRTEWRSVGGAPKAGILSRNVPRTKASKASSLA
ncbi:MAG: hypothetical protein ACLR0U_30190 [Enterocloster clostridioformis]